MAAKHPNAEREIKHKSRPMTLLILIKKQRAPEIFDFKTTYNVVIDVEVYELQNEFILSATISVFVSSQCSGDRNHTACGADVVLIMERRKAEQEYWLNFL
jgi:hypothetical protein